MKNKRVRILWALITVLLISASLTISVCAMTVNVTVSSSGGTVDVDIKPDNTVFELKEAVQRKVGVPAEKQIIMFAGNPLDNDKTIEEYRIEDGALVAMKISETADTDYNSGNKDKDETTGETSVNEIDADGKIIIGSFIVNSSNVKIVSYVAITIAAFVIVILIVLRKKS